MKEHKANDAQHAKLRIEDVEEEVAETKESDTEETDLFSIQEFIEKKKLQNKILKKMLDRMNEPENLKQ